MSVNRELEVVCCFWSINFLCHFFFFVVIVRFVVVVVLFCFFVFFGFWFWFWFWFWFVLCCFYFLILPPAILEKSYTLTQTLPIFFPLYLGQPVTMTTAPGRVLPLLTFSDDLKGLNTVPRTPKDPYL